MEKIFFLKKFAPNYSELLIFTVMSVPTLTTGRWVYCHQEFVVKENNGFPNLCRTKFMSHSHKLLHLYPIALKLDSTLLRGDFNACGPYNGIDYSPYSSLHFGCISQSVSYMGQITTSLCQCHTKKTMALDQWTWAHRHQSSRRDTLFTPAFPGRSSLYMPMLTRK